MVPAAASPCLTDERLHAYAEGVLDAAEHDAVTDHIERCAPCRRLVASAFSDRGTAPLRRGALLGRYVVLDRIGEGAMGTVYAASDPDLDRKIALKVLRTDGSEDDRAALRARLLREARALAKLSHPNVVAVHDVGIVDDELFLAMELVPAGTLRAWAQAKPRTWREIVGVFLAAGEGLAAAHAADVVHRDFKPDNVLVAEDGRVCVVDFGLARGFFEARVEVPDDGLGGATSRIGAVVTQTGALAGTPAYMAPEQRAGEPASKASDQYAFALSLYELLFGSRPRGPALLEATVDGPKPPAPVRPLLLRALDEEPARRHASLRVLLDALASTLRPTRARSLAFALLATSVLLAAGAAASSRRDPCADAAASFDEAWGPATRSRVEAVTTKAGSPLARDGFVALDRTLAAYGLAFVEAERKVCLGSRNGRTEPAATLERRASCLAERRLAAEALTRAIVASPDDRTLERAVSAARSLPEIDICARADVLAGLAPLPADPQRRREVVALERRVTQLSSEQRLGRGRALEAPLLAAVDEAQRLAWHRASARGLLELSRLRYDYSDAKAAQTASEATAAALRARDDEALADAWTHLLEMEAHYNRVEGAEHAFRQAEAAAQRLGAPARRRVELLAALANVYLRTGRDLERASALLEEARVLAERSLSEDDPLFALVVNRLGIAAHFMARFPVALTHFERAFALVRQSQGELHPDTDKQRINVGEELVLNGRAAEGLAMIRGPLARRADNPHHWDSLAVAHEALAEFDGALHARRETLRLCREAHDPACARWAQGRLGSLLARLGRKDEAIAELEAALVDDAQAEIQSNDRAKLRVALATALAGSTDVAARARVEGLARGAAEDIRPWAERYGGPYRETLREAEALAAPRALRGPGGRPAEGRRD